VTGRNGDTAKGFIQHLCKRLCWDEKPAGKPICIDVGNLSAQTIPDLHHFSSSTHFSMDVNYYFDFLALSLMRLTFLQSSRILGIGHALAEY
jgi:hypothetical protein